MKKVNPKIKQAGVVLLLAIITMACNHSKSNSKTQTELGYRSVKILNVDHLQFKDLNRNDKLDPYEDWRLSTSERSKDLISRMSLEQKAGFMLISTTRMENDRTFQQPVTTDPVSSGFNESDLVMNQNMFTRVKLDYPNMFAAGTTKAVTEFHERHFILRANPSAKIIAQWANNLQALCESDGLGIPAIIASNPRNHITMDASAGLSIGKTDFSIWPGELGLAAMRDFELTRKFADIARQEWASVGLRKGYMYMADLCTEPRWQRAEGTFGEDAQLAANMIREVVLGFQGDSLNSSSVALTTKHFPGGGATEGGQDPHFAWGKREIFEGGMLQNNLIPFKAAIEAGTSSIMPYYSIPLNTEYPEVAYAFNKPVLQGLLRGEMGFDGIINSDTGPIDMMPWGVENLSMMERYKKSIEAGVNIFSGSADPAVLIETLERYPGLMPLVDESVKRLLKEKFELGLFENPYVSPEKAETLVGNPEFQEKADLAMRKSIVLLRNEIHQNKKALPLEPGTKVYFENCMKAKDNTPGQIILPEQNKWNLEFVETPEEADIILLWIVPKSKALFDSDGSPLFLSLSQNNVDIEHIRQLTNTKPTILSINFSNPWVIDEIYQTGNKNVQALLATFGTTPEALLDVVSGTFYPTGKMPFSTPVSERKAQSQQADVPGYIEGDDYALFHFNEGLSY